MKKLQSIRTKLVMAIVVIFAVTVVAFSTITGISMVDTTYCTLDVTMSEMVEVAGAQFSSYIMRLNTLMGEIAVNDILADPSSTTEEINAFLAKKNAQYGGEYGGDIFYADKTGKVSSLDLVITDRDFFKRAIVGESFLADPVVRKDTGELAYTYAVPVKDGAGVKGILYIMVSYDKMYKIISTIKIGEQGDVYLINKNGGTILAEDTQKIIGQYNTAQAAQSDSSLSGLAYFETDAAQGNTGFGEYKKSYVVYTPVPETDGWSVIVTADKSEFFSDTVRSIVRSAVTSLIMAVIGVLALSLIASRIVGPMQAMTRRMKRLAEGDLSTPIDEVDSADEVGQLNRAMSDTVDSLRNYVQDIDNVTSKIALGDFCVRVERDYAGDFAAIKISLEKILQTLGTSFAEISGHAQEVADGSGQMAYGAQMLSHGAERQASTVQELTATITEISAQVKTTASKAQQADEQVSSTGEQIMECNQQMQQMNEAMRHINDTSGEIGKIIKTIEDIAFQTNILALNAAVEAARAGEAGKGFAVVADEVRSLANKSQEAARNTTALIESSLKAVESGARIANETTASLGLVVENARMLTETIGGITAAAEEQAGSISQITQGMDQISQVVQTASATAEQSASTSSQLSLQAQQLKELVERFRINGQEDF